MDGSDEAVAGSDSPAADDHRAVSPSPEKDDDSVRYSLAWWLSFAVPISIALVAIVGAVVGYRAESHDSLSSVYDNDAEISSTYLSGHVYNALRRARHHPALEPRSADEA